MMDLDVIAIVTGIILPFVTPLLYKAAWAEWVKFLIVIAIATAAGLIQLAIAGEFADLQWNNVVAHISIIYAASAPVFWLAIDKTGLREWLEAHGVT